MNKKRGSHSDPTGRDSIVENGGETEMERTAVARGKVTMQKDTLELIKAGELKKGDVLEVAQTTGIDAAKNTSDLIPFCDPLQLNSIKIDFELDNNLPGIVIRAEVKTSAKTDGEMEALTAVSVAALTICVMAKSTEKTLRIEDIHLVEKKSGKYSKLYKRWAGKK